ncbi:hypothetical protein NDN11_10670 [Acinetobacter sp. C26M]|uniref:hypothetical protein n=1 Tax=unclassified Acinetobacter TaxID=196816 RepID=UPI0020375D2A|nr:MULTISPECIES: hypothetical protein [unclassified Acinetobacter]USA45193.1 hypothetical protein NDN11_10670 [Acinetobacter sp. C26M]USA48695.1 hypothetical protein NDN12_10670 [Acinetobacter sp. C26G]
MVGIELSKKTTLLKIFGGVCDYSFDTKIGTDNIQAVNRSLAALNYCVITGNCAVSDVIYLKTDQSLLKANENSVIVKTTNKKGVGGNLAPSRNNITDSYAVDACVILTHTNNAYTTNVKLDINLSARNPSADSIAVYAPRFYFCNFTNKVFGFGTGVQVYDGFNSVVGVKVIGSCYGFRWLSDGSGNMTGTSIDFSNSWVLFNTSYNQPVKGFDLYQLWYTFGSNIAVDNGTRADGAAIIGYKFYNCKSIEFSAVGAENNRGCIVKSEFSNVEFHGLKTATIYGGDFTSEVGFFEVLQGTLTLSNGNLNDIVGVGNMYAEILGEAGIITYNNTQPVSNGSKKAFGNNALRSINSGVSDRVYTAQDVYQTKEGIIKKQTFAAQAYQGLFKLFTTSSISLLLTVNVKTASGTINSKFNIIFSGSYSKVANITSLSTSETLTLSLDISANGNVFSNCSSAGNLSFTIECYDTYLFGSAENFISIY